MCNGSDPLCKRILGKGSEVQELQEFRRAIPVERIYTRVESTRIEPNSEIEDEDPNFGA